MLFAYSVVKVKSPSLLSHWTKIHFSLKDNTPEGGVRRSRAQPDELFQLSSAQINRVLSDLQTRVQAQPHHNPVERASLDQLSPAPR